MTDQVAFPLSYTPTTSKERPIMECAVHFHTPKAITRGTRADMSIWSTNWYFGYIHAWRNITLYSVTNIKAGLQHGQMILCINDAILYWRVLSSGMCRYNPPRFLRNILLPYSRLMRKLNKKPARSNLNSHSLRLLSLTLSSGHVSTGDDIANHVCVNDCMTTENKSPLLLGITWQLSITEITGMCMPCDCLVRVTN